DRLFNAPNHTPYVKDAFDRYIVHGETNAVNPGKTGTKAAANYKVTLPSRSEIVLKMRLTDKAKQLTGSFFSAKNFDGVFKARVAEADEFYASLASDDLSDDAKN